LPIPRKRPVKSCCSRNVFPETIWHFSTRNDARCRERTLESDIWNSPSLWRRVGPSCEGNLHKLQTLFYSAFPTCVAYRRTPLRCAAVVSPFTEFDLMNCLQTFLIPSTVGLISSSFHHPWEAYSDLRGCFELWEWSLARSTPPFEHASHVPLCLLLFLRVFVEEE